MRRVTPPANAVWAGPTRSEDRKTVRHPTVALVLAEASSHAIVGGMTVLERLVRNTREAWPTTSIMVVWRGADRSVGTVLATLEVSEHHHGAPLPAARFAGGGDVALLSGALVTGRGVLPVLLARDEGGGTGWPVRAVPAALLSAMPTLDWEALAARLPTTTPESALPEVGFVATLASPADAPAIHRRLLASLGKPSDGYVARYLNRAVSTRLTGVLANTPITPDAVSVGVLALALGAGWFAAQGDASGFVLGCALNQGASMLDGTDGELARLKFLDSRRGAWIDTAIDQIGNHLFILAMGIGLSRQPFLSARASQIYFWEGIFTTLGMALCVGLVARHTRRTSSAAHFNGFNDNLRRDADKGGWLRRAFAAGVPVFRRDTYALVFVVLALMQVPEVVLHFLTIGMLAHLPAIAWVWWKDERQAALASADRGVLHG